MFTHTILYWDSISKNRLGEHTVTTVTRLEISLTLNRIAYKLLVAYYIATNSITLDLNIINKFKYDDE